MDLPGGEGVLLAVLYALVGVLFVLSCLRGVWFDERGDAARRHGGRWLSAGELCDEELQGVLALLAEGPGRSEDSALALVSAVDECCLLHDYGVLIGMAAVRWRADDELELCEVVVASCVQRVGHGTLLLAFCLERARGLCIPVYVTLENPRKGLCSWFERVGFARVSPESDADHADSLVLRWHPDLDAASEVDSMDVAVGSSPRAKQE
jgi:N-acetylglutamate synthase-like GNAT family acetyltransferase